MAGKRVNRGYRCPRCGRVKPRLVTNYRALDSLLFLAGAVVGGLIVVVVDVVVPGAVVIGAMVVPVFGGVVVWLVGGERELTCPRCGMLCTLQDTAEAIREALEADPWVQPNLSRICVRVDEGVVHLSGTVDSVTARMHATDVAKRVPGALEVVNTIVVQTPTSHGESAQP